MRKRWYEVHVRFNNNDCFDTYFHDITIHKNNDEKIRRQSALIRSLLDSIPDIIFYKDTDGVYLGCNAEFARHVGLDIKEITGKTDYDLYPREMADFFRENDRKMMEKKTSRHNEEWITYPDGKKVLLDTLKTPYWGPDGNLIGTLGISRDITTFKEIENKIQQRDELFQKVLSTIPDMISIHDTERNILYSNWSGLAAVSEEEKVTVLNTKDQKNCRKSNEICLDFHVSDVLKTKKTYQNEINLSDGTWVDLRVLPILNQNNDVEFFVEWVRDITELKKNEHFLDQSNKEINILLSEIHHRVKNNMAIISSMISMESEFKTHNKTCSEVFSDIQNRITSMSLVHELVYENKNFAEINFAEVLRRLTVHLMKIYNNPLKHVSIAMDAENVMIDMNKSLPLSLLANELITNAYKHAFPDQESGRINISFKKDADGYEFILWDNGIGVQEIEEFNNPETYGYTIIQGLVRQLRGSIKISSLHSGLEISIRFPEKI